MMNPGYNDQSGRSRAYLILKSQLNSKYSSHILKFPLIHESAKITLNSVNFFLKNVAIFSVIFNRYKN